MKKPSYEIVFNRKKILKPDGTALVQIRIYHAYRLKYVSTGVSVTPEQWHPDKWVVNHKDSVDLNRQIREYLRDLENIELRARLDNQNYSINMLGSKRQINPGNFLKFMEHEISKANISKDTKRHHTSTLNHLKAYKKITSVADLTQKNIMGWDEYLRGKKLQTNSIYGQHKKMKRYIKIAMNEGLLQNDPYKQFRPPTGNKDIVRYLIPDELQKIEKTVIHSLRLKTARDMFLFACYTGLAYQELSGLTKDNLIYDTDGTVWVTGERLKLSTNIQHSCTGKYSVPLHSKAIAIIEKYKDQTRKPGKLLPVISNQQYNLLLKEVQGLCSINSRLTTHVARHTFATTFTLSKGISLESVKEMLGHSSIKMTEKYAKVLNVRVKEEMKKIFKRK